MVERQKGQKAGNALDPPCSWSLGAFYNSVWHLYPAWDGGHSVDGRVAFCFLGGNPVFATAPHALMFADAAAATVLTTASDSLALADAAATAVLTLALLSLVLADAAADTVFTLAPPSLVHTDAAATAGFVSAPLSMVFAKIAGRANRAFDDAVTIWLHFLAERPCLVAWNSFLFSSSSHDCLHPRALTRSIFLPVSFSITTTSSFCSAGLLAVLQRERVLLPLVQFV